MSGTTLPGASSLQRVDGCVVSEALPHFVSAPHEYTRLGDIMHAFMEAAFNVGRDGALAWAFERHPHLLEALEMVPFDRLPQFDTTKWQPEVSFAYDVEKGTCRILGTGLNRNTARSMAEPHELVLTVDLAGSDEGSGVCLDWKSGFKDVEPAATNWQVKTGLLAVCRALGLKGGRVAVVRVLWSGVVLPWEWVAMDEHDLNAHEAALRLLMRRRARVLAKAAAGEELPPPVLGSYCEYCPALRSCPAHIQLVKALASTEGLEEMSPEQLGKAYRELERREAALKLVRGWFSAVARQDAIPLENGEVLGEKLVATESILPERAQEALEALFGAEVARVVLSEAVSTNSKLTKKALRSALKSYALPTLPEDRRKITFVERETLARLRESRALTVRTSKQVKKYRPGKTAETNEEIPDAEEEAA